MTPQTADAVVPPQAGDATPPTAGAVEPALAAPSSERAGGGLRSLALVVLTVLASVYALSWAQTLIVPLLLGIFIAYTLNPLVSWLESIRIVRPVGTVLVMAGVIGGLTLGSYSLRGQMQTIIEQLPEATSKVTSALGRLHVNPNGNIQKMQAAATEVQKATAQATGGTPVTRQPATHVVVDQPAFKLDTFLWTNSLGAVGALGQAAMVVFLAFFLLLGGDLFKRKLVRLTGPSLSKRKITVHMLDDINDSIQKYMLMLLATNLLVGVLNWAALTWIGLDNAGAWALAAGLLHLVPYLGPAAAATAAGVAAFVQFDSVGTACLVAAASLAIATVVGTFVTTWMTGRIANMNPAAVFISLLFWGWLWGVWGMLLSIPLVVIAKVVAQHVTDLHPVAELLGD